MSLFRALLFVADPLIIAFIVSVLIGVLFRGFSGQLLLKRSLTLLSAIGYLTLLVYCHGILCNEVISYIVLFAPIAVILIFIIIAFIFAPKGEVENSEMDKSFETKKFVTGWDSMFPDDLDEYDKSRKD